MIEQNWTKLDKDEDIVERNAIDLNKLAQLLTVILV